MTQPQPGTCPRCGCKDILNRTADKPLPDQSIRVRGECRHCGKVVTWRVDKEGALQR